jgi:putative endonuclease
MLSIFTPKCKDDLSFPLGKRGELIAQDIYRQKGFRIIAANEFNRNGKQAGEIDFIATDTTTIIFVEVKTRAQEMSKQGTGAEAVNYFKQQKLLKAAKLFLLRNPKYQRFCPKIDVCVVILGNVDKQPKSVTIISNAVEDMY